MNPEPSLSVSVITYNHERFIEETLRGILTQECNFLFDVHVSDDASSDDTPAIIERLARENPGVIIPHLSQQRMGMKVNFMTNISRCTGVYVALCDGDDLWTSVHKLQLQHDFLEANKDFSTCFHAVQLVNREGTTLLTLPQPPMNKPVSGLADLVEMESFMATSSIVFRRPEEPIFPPWFDQLTNIVDLPLNMVNAQSGPIGYIDELMGVYRSNSSAHAFSASDSIDIYTEANRMFDLMERHLPSKFAPTFSRKRVRNLTLIMKSYLARGDTKAAKACLEEIRSAPLNQDYNSRRHLLTYRILIASRRLLPRIGYLAILKLSDKLAPPHSM